jgi:capsular exopolysaccharide synthesis family protein
MEPIEYLRVIRRRWLVVALATLVFAGGAWATTAFASPSVETYSYQSRAILLRTGGLSLNTMAAFVGLRPVAVRAAERIGFDGDPTELLSHISADFDGESGFLVITATADSPEEARVLANAYAKALIGFIEDGFVPGGSRTVARQIAELQQEVADLDARLLLGPPPAEASILREQMLQSATLLQLLTEAYTQAFASRLGGPGLTVVQPAYRNDQIVPTGLQLPDSPPVRLALGGILGLVVGIALALVLARFDTRIRSREGAEEHFQLPVLAEIPLIKRADRDRVVAASDPSSPASQAFSLLGAEMLREPVPYGDGDGHAGAPRGSPQTILVTSAGNAEGKSTVVANLAVALSETGKRVLVVSCDFRRPAVHRLFGVPNSEGLAQALELESANGKPVLEGHIKTTQFSDIWVVPSGPASKRPGELLSSGGMRRALSEARTAADVILLDSAPILAGSDATQLLPDVDGVLVVARAGTTTSQLAERASGLLRRLRAPVLGVALNAAESPVAPKGVRAK